MKTIVLMAMAAGANLAMGASSLIYHRWLDAALCLVWFVVLAMQCWDSARRYRKNMEISEGLTCVSGDRKVTITSCAGDRARLMDALQRHCDDCDWITGHSFDELVRPCRRHASRAER